MTRWRWRQDPTPGTPDGNMAADALLLREVREGAPPAVRVYTWDRPCVSIGRLQDEAAVRAAYPGLPIVRRPTGGRAVLHGEDLCLSVAACLSDLPASDSTGILATYRLLAGALVDTFCGLGTPAQFGADACPTRTGFGGRSFVDCFAAVARCDIVHAKSGQKLAGCAQRREGPVLLQQMSVRNVPQSAAAFADCARHSLATRLSIEEWISD